MKKIIAILIAAMLLVSLAACGTTAETPNDTATNAPADNKTPTNTAPSKDAEPIVLVLAHGSLPDNTLGMAIQKFADEVAVATEGRVSFEVYPSGQLGSGAGLIEAVDVGEVAMTMADTSLMTETVPELYLLSMPMLVKDFDGWKRLVYSDEIGEALKTIVAEKSNMYMLGYVFNGFREILSVNDITSLDSCKGTIIRSPEAEIYIQTFQRMNFTPTPLPASEVYTALSSGVCEAADTSYEGHYKASYYEVCKNILESNHMAATMTIVVDQKIWDSIPASDREIVMGVYDSVFSQCSEDVNANAINFKNQLIAEGCDVYNYTADEQAILVERFTDYWNEAAASYGFEDLLAKAVDMR